MNGIGQRLRQVRKKSNETQAKVAKVCGVSRAAVALWETGRTNPSLDNLVVVAKYLGVSVGWLLGEPGSSTRKRTQVRITRPISLITSRRAKLWDQEKIRRSKGVVDVLHTDMVIGSRAFALKIEDQSMAPELRPGDIVFIDPDTAPIPGDFVLAQLPAQKNAVIRKYRPKAASPTEYPDVELVPLNIDWPEILLDVDNPGRVIGPVVELRRPRENCHIVPSTSRQQATDTATPARLSLVEPPGGRGRT